MKYFDSLKKFKKTKLCVAVLTALVASSVAYGAVEASGEDSTALGTFARASGEDSTALGTFANASGENSTALGAFARASGEDSTALGTFANASGEDSTALGTFAEASGASSMALGTFAEASGEDSTALGTFAEASGASSMALGTFAEASGASSMALGRNSSASGASSMALGYSSKASGEDSTALGRNSRALGNSSVALGVSSKTGADLSIALGSYSATSDDRVLIKVNETGEVIQFKGIYDPDLSPLLDTYGTDGLEFISEVAVGSVGGFNEINISRKITGVFDGKISENSREAVNGSQLFKTNKNIQEVYNQVEENSNDIKNLWDQVTNIANVDNRVTVNEGNIQTNTDNNTDNIANVDNRITDTKVELNQNIERSKNETIKVSNQYTDVREVAIRNDMAEGNINTLKSANNYTDNSINDTKVELNQNVREVAIRNDMAEGNINTLKSANNYTDNSIADTKVELNQNIDRSKNEAIKVSNQYTDVREVVIRNDMAEGDRNTLKSANTYTDNRIDEMNSNINSALDGAYSYIRQENKRMRDEYRAIGSLAMASSAIGVGPRELGRSQLGVAVGSVEGASAIAIGLNHYVNDKTVLTFRGAMGTSKSVSGGAVGVIRSW